MLFYSFLNWVLPVPRLHAVISSLHKQHYWQPFSHYRFAAEDIYAPLTVNEFKQAAIVCPILFLQKDGIYQPVMLQGLDNQQNLLVNDSGQWIASYVPAYYRSHPFAFAKNEAGHSVLSFYHDSEFVHTYCTTGSAAHPFFDGTTLSAKTEEICDFLIKIEANWLATKAVCKSLQRMDLFRPWSYSAVMGEEKRQITGLHCIDETKLRALQGDALYELQSTDALGAIYSHLLSTQLTKHLSDLYQSRRRRRDAPADSVSPDLFSSVRDNGLIDLDL
ncbi:MAG: hypothetical protein ACI9SK_000934 [Zhongshania sp.]